MISDRRRRPAARRRSGRAGVTFRILPAPPLTKITRTCPEFRLEEVRLPFFESQSVFYCFERKSRGVEILAVLGWDIQTSLFLFLRLLRTSLVEFELRRGSRLLKRHNWSVRPRLLELAYYHRCRSIDGIDESTVIKFDARKGGLCARAGGARAGYPDTSISQSVGRPKLRRAVSALPVTALSYGGRMGR
ncbi:hypothetical protein EVAR_13607_1 [Eumeta japonica]|uniref:Uncharacterized protein n=1 Tax=Eumeta variegata TaxID=151549 RepID=A0A4C1UV65_EUMVA|nr:hypothetical protein EVAR_13607_1 [Eumeta japonica]